MSSSKMFLIVCGAFLLVGFTVARPASDKDTVTDVHLNAVLPESEKGAAKLVESPQRDASQNTETWVSSSSANLELVTDETTDSDITIVTQRPSYFSRLIQSIFDIPISVLQSVRNLIQTTATKPAQNN